MDQVIYTNIKEHTHRQRKYRKINRCTNKIKMQIDIQTDKQVAKRSIQTEEQTQIFAGRQTYKHKIIIITYKVFNQIFPLPFSNNSNYKKLISDLSIRVKRRSVFCWVKFCPIGMTFTFLKLAN
jgi:hypothetical protein